MAETKQFRNLTEYHNGNSAENNIKLSDVAPFQHENLATNTNKLGKMNMAQTFCEPVAVCNSNSPADGAYTATCVNYPDFAVSYDDSHGTSHYLYGMKVRVIFTYGITYGSVDQGTYPTLSINGSGALPLLAQGKTMARGAISAGQSVEFTIIPYGNSIAFDADSNVRENTNDYTIYTDGSKLQRGSHRENVTGNVTSKLIATLQPNETIIVNAFAYPNNSTPTSLQIAVSSEWGVAYSTDAPFCSATLVYTNKEGFPVNITYSATWDNSNVNRTGYDFIIITK